MHEVQEFGQDYRTGARIGAAPTSSQPDRRLCYLVVRPETWSNQQMIVRGCLPRYVVTGQVRAQPLQSVLKDSLGTYP